MYKNIKIHKLYKRLKMTSYLYELAVGFFYICRYLKYFIGKVRAKFEGHFWK